MKDEEKDGAAAKDEEVKVEEDKGADQQKEDGDEKEED